jgi:predicted amidohydrolase YtcJ
MIDLLLDNCSIHTNEERFECLGISGDKIEYLGNQPPSFSFKRKVDLEGAQVLPGFVDSHTHLLSLGLSATGLDLSHARSRDEALNMVREWVVKKGKADFVIGSGWDESSWGEEDYLSRDELDFTSTPVVLYRRDKHMAVLNSSALRLLNLEDRRDGILKEKELDKIEGTFKADRDTKLRAIKTAFERCLSEGVTSVRDIVDYETYTLYREVGSTPIDVRFCVLHEQYLDDMKRDNRFWGVKVFMDGSIGAKTAAVTGWPKGNLLMSKERLNLIAEGFWKSGIPLAIHAIGDIATSVAQQVLSSSSRGVANSIEHFELFERDILKEMQRVFASCQPNFLQWSGKGGLYERRLGKKWARINNAYRWILDEAVPLAFGSDCMPIGPLYGIRLAYDSTRRAQRITFNEALGAYTESSANLLGLAKRGTIRRGYYADLVVIDGEVPRGAKVRATIKNGKVCYGKLAKKQ